MRLRRKREQPPEEASEPQDAGEAPRLQDTTERAAMPLPLPGNERVPAAAAALPDAPVLPAPVTEPDPEADAELVAAATPAADESPPQETATTTFEPLRSDPAPFPAPPTIGGAMVAAPPARRPEVLVGAAFVGGLALALILRRRRG